MEEYKVNLESLSGDLRHTLRDFSLTNLSEPERGFKWTYNFNNKIKNKNKEH